MDTASITSLASKVRELQSEFDQSQLDDAIQRLTQQKNLQVSEDVDIEQNLCICINTKTDCAACWF